MQVGHKIVLLSSADGSFSATEEGLLPVESAFGFQDRLSKAIQFAHSRGRVDFLMGRSTCDPKTRGGVGEWEPGVEDAAAAAAKADGDELA